MRFLLQTVVLLLEEQWMMYGAVSHHQVFGKMLIAKSLLPEICLVFPLFGNEPFFRKQWFRIICENQKRKCVLEKFHIENEILICRFQLCLFLFATAAGDIYASIYVC